MKIDLTELNKQINKGLIRVQHNKTGLHIYNYTQDCQFNKKWNDLSLMCRGLILDDEGNIIALPLKKFFNDAELQGLNIVPPSLPFEVWEKMDGSLGISYIDTDNKTKIATRGSFQSEQAIFATDLLNKKYSHITLNPDITYLFEIIYSSNRIVVDYGKKEELVLLAMINRKTGEELPLENIGFPLPERYDGITDFRTIKKKYNNLENHEGFIVKFSNGFRMKIKLDEYVRLHRILTGINEKAIWEVLKNNQSLESFLKGVPEEFATWINNVVEGLQVQYKQILNDVNEKVKEIEKEIPEFTPDKEKRKLQAQKVFAKLPEEYSGIAFNMLQGKKVGKIIWKLIKPIENKGFSNE